MTTRAFIAGCSGFELTPDEVAFFREAKPWGFILFRRNVDNPEQVRALCDSLRDIVGNSDAPILIDQEGGRVQRMGPPHWPKYPSGATYGRLHANDPLVRREIARLGGAADRSRSARGRDHGGLPAGARRSLARRP